MGAKQSKRSVDISGKEAESAGEVAAAGAGGEGRVEPIADVDALKPQLNGDAQHIQEPSEKEKQLDVGTPENEKDATTEKETKENGDDQKEAAPVTNGDAEQKTENGESTPSPEDNKKPKKEKVKKKWSLRSISFSRKDKPKQEKKTKEEEKANGEPEKVPEEVTDTLPEVEKTEEVQEAKPEPEEIKEEKTPETPVTEPITNGSSTPETPKIETPIANDPTDVKPVVESAEPKIEEPEQLPVNGLSLEEPKIDVSESKKIEPSLPEETSVESPVPATEIPVKNEVCVEQMPLIEPTPPPLPATPPPSSVASFAATTMAPELTNASLANSADIAFNASAVLPILTNENIADIECSNAKHETEVVPALPSVEEINTNVEDVNSKDTQIYLHSEVEQSKEENTVIPNEVSGEELNNHETLDICKEEKAVEDSNKVPNITNSEVPDFENFPPPAVDNYINDNDSDNEVKKTNKNKKETNQTIKFENIPNEINGHQNGTIEENYKNTKNTQDTLLDDIQCNGDKDGKPLVNGEVLLPIVDNVADSVKTPEESTPPFTPPLSEAIETIPQGGVDVSNDASESFPLPPSELCFSESEVSPPDTPEHIGEVPSNTSQEPLLSSDKLTELIPEVPVVPELKSEMESSTDVAVAN